MNPIIRRIVQKVTEQLNTCQEVTGLTVFGSVARKEEDFYSDIDLYVYCKDSTDFVQIKKEVKRRVIAILNEVEEGVSREFDRSQKWLVYTKKSFLKLEVGIKSISQGNKEDVVYVVQSRVKDPKEAILIDKDGDLQKLFEEHWFSFETKVASEFTELLDGFLYYYESSRLHLTRGDIFRAYMNYTIAFFKLAGMEALAHGEMRNLYQPLFLTKDIVTDQNHIQRIKKVATGLDGISMQRKGRMMASLFIDATEKAARHFNLDFERVEVEEFINNVENKYPLLYNFRDISKIVNSFSDGRKIRAGRIFRSASLSRYDSETVIGFLQERKIKKVLDLRAVQEIEKLGLEKNRYYEDWFTGQYVINIPITPSDNVSEVNNDFINMYRRILVQESNAIGHVFKTMATTIEEGAILIHCEGGKDRTGIVVALMLEVLGVEREDIVHDYLVSYNDTRREYIEFVFDLLDEQFGGAEKYLIEYCQIPGEVLAKLKESLI